MGEEKVTRQTVGTQQPICPEPKLPFLNTWTHQELNLAGNEWHVGIKISILEPHRKQWSILIMCLKKQQRDFLGPMPLIAEFSQARRHSMTLLPSCWP